MDAFWLIPTAIITIAFLAVLYAFIGRRPLASHPPNVIVDKPLDKPLIDEDVQKRDWEERPCGNYMEWQSGKSKPD